MRKSKQSLLTCKDAVGSLVREWGIWEISENFLMIPNDVAMLYLESYKAEPYGNLSPIVQICR